VEEKTLALSPPVVVEMSAADAGAPYAQVLVDACSAGLRGGRTCALEGTTSDSAPAVAIVSWEGAGRSAAKIDVGVKRGARADWLTRRVTFDASDAEVERWRSVGLIIATLVGSGEAADADAPRLPLAAPVPASVGATRSVSPPSSGGGSWFFEVGAAVARGAGDVVGAGGPSGRVGTLFRSLPLFVTGSLRYEIEPRATAQVRLEWAWVALGLGVAVPLGDAPLLLEARVEPTLGGIRASSLVGPQEQSGALFGVREGAGLTWWWGRSFGVSLFADVLETTRSAVVNVSASTSPGVTQVAKAQWLGWSTGLGLRFRTD
jgi:hypothetical protein